MNTYLKARPSYHRVLVAAAVAVGMGVGATDANAGDASTPTPHSDSVGAVITDSVITLEVKAKLFDEKSLKHSDVSVTTTNGVVTLEGSASSRHARSVAESAARSVDGVKSVDDELSTPAGGRVAAKTQDTVDAATRAVSDTWITTQVKSEILADSLSKGFDVNVDTTGGVVALNGALASQHAIDHVKGIAEKVEGVKSVDTSALVVEDR